MTALIKIFEFILHIDKYLQAIVSDYSGYTYAILFLIIFCETGLVIMPFLPGDSLLFAAGALAAGGSLNIWLLFIIVLLAATIGDAVNYHIGKYIGPKIFKKESSLFFHKEHLIKAQSFYEKHGKKMIILARFIPIVRTFAPFVAGIGVMPYPTFLSYNIIGGTIWTSLFLFSGFIFGNLSFVKERFSLLVVAIIIISFLPIAKDVYFHLREKRVKKIT